MKHVCQVSTFSLYKIYNTQTTASKSTPSLFSWLTYYTPVCQSCITLAEEWTSSPQIKCSNNLCWSGFFHSCI